MPNRTIWAITDGKAGIVNQALGLADAMARVIGACQVVEKLVTPSYPWSLLPAGFWPRGIRGTTNSGTAWNPPWPDAVVSCGRHAVGPAIWVKRQSGGRTKLVHAQHPRTAARHFDVIVAQSHDRLNGSNVINALGSMHRITEDRLADALERDGERFSAIPRPTVAVLIGGTNKTFRMTPTIAGRLATDLRALMDETGCGLLVTASRRTGEENLALLRDRVTGPGIYFWDETGENPYSAFLARADAFLVTGDSVNMISEACFTGKPVHIIALAGGEGSKFERFHADICAGGYARPFAGRLEQWEGKKLDETARVAAEILDRLKLRSAGGGSPQAA